MARQDFNLRQKQREEQQRQKTLRRNQVFFAILSGIIILSMLISLVRW